jgi:AcrR family transcriptional regulator
MGDVGSIDSDGAELGARAGRRAQSRRRILDAARAVFFRDGFMAANLDQVADLAGVAKGTLYRYFDNKADLYVGVLADNGKVFSSRMRETAALPGSARHRLDGLGRFNLDHRRNHREYFQIFWAIDNQRVIGQLPPGVVDEVVRLWEESLAILSDVLADGVRDGEFVECDPWAVANILWTVANAVIQSDATETRRQLRRTPLDVVYTQALALIFQGLERPGS